MPCCVIEVCQIKKLNAIWEKWENENMYNIHVINFV